MTAAAAVTRAHLGGRSIESWGNDHVSVIRLSSRQCTNHILLCWGIQHVNDSHGEGVVTACRMGPESCNCPENKTEEQAAACDGFGMEWRNFNL